MFTTIFNLKPRTLFITLHLCATLIFTLHYAIVGNAVWGDGRYYFVYLRSAVIDQDLDFSNERLVDPFYFDNKPTPIGKVGNKYSIGPPLFWSPAYVFAHSLKLTGYFLGLPVSIDGHGHVYRYFVGLLSVAYITFGLWLIYKVLLQYFSRNLSLLAISATAVGTHVFYYYALDPINSHPPSIFISSVIFFLLSQSAQATKIKTSIIFLLGLLTGVLGMIRTHDLIFFFPIFAWVMFKPLQFLIKIKHVCVLIVGSVLGFLPQLLVWQHLYGTINSPYLIGGESFDITRANFLNVLVSHNNGLFSYSPLLLLSVVGLIRVLRQKDVLAKYGLVLLVLQSLVLGSWSGWWGGQSFGGRMFLSLTPFFTLGLAAGLKSLSPKLQTVTTTVSVICTQALALWYLLIH